MNTIICLNDEKRKALQAKLKHKDGRVVLHAVILLLLDLLPPKTVAPLLGLSHSNLYKRKDRFLCEGLDSLGHQPRSGRPSELKDHQERIMTCLEHSPRRYGFCTSLWTTHLLAQTLLIQTGWTASAESVRRQLHAMKYRWKRPRHGPTKTNDPEAAAKIQRIQEVEERIKSEPENHLLYVDEADFNLLSSIRASWSKVGDQPVFPTPGKNAKIFAFGSYEPATKRFLYHVRYRKRAVEFKAFLKHLLERYSGKLYIVLDNVVTHKAASIQKFVETNRERLELLFIPTYSPQYNQPIERLWGTCRTWVNGNESCETLTSLYRRTRTGLQRQQTLLRLEAAAA